MKRENILRFLILNIVIGIAGCDNATDSNGSSGSPSNENPAQTSQAPAQTANTPESPKQQAATSSAENLMRLSDAFDSPEQKSGSSVIEIQETKALVSEEKGFLDEESYNNLEDVHKYNVLHFKFNKDELKNPKNLHYWIGLNSCEKADKIHDEFEWPSIVSEYTNSIDSVLGKIPATMNIMLSGYLGQYDMKEKTFPVLADHNKNEEYKIEVVGISRGTKSICKTNAMLEHSFNYNLDFSQAITIPKILMDESTARDYVANHSSPYSRKIILSIDLDVVGIGQSKQPHEVSFKAMPKKIAILDADNREKVIHEFNFQVAN